MHVHEKLLYTLLLCSALLCVSLSSPAQEQTRDDYKVFVKNETGQDIWYTFQKTNRVGTTIPEPILFVVPIDKSNRIQQTVVPELLPVLERKKNLSERIMQFTNFFVSLSKPVLEKKLMGATLTSKEKKEIASEKMPSKLLGYCSESVVFTVKKQGTKLTVKVDDNRKCTRSESKEAKVRQRVAPPAYEEAPSFKESLAHGAFVNDEAPPAYE